jgi:hypothetical protein
MTYVLNALILAGTLAIVLTLIIGICSMVYHGDNSPFDSEHWMRYRVYLQAIAVLALIGAFIVGK